MSDEAFVTRVLSELTTIDERKRRTDRHWNPYFLGIVCRDAIPGLRDSLEAGSSREDAFADVFTPTRETNAVARKLGLNLSVERGRWVMPDGSLV